MRSFVLLIAIVFAVLTPITAFAQQEIFYAGNIQPDGTSSCGAGISWTPFDSEGGVTNLGTLVQDPDATDGWAWFIADTSSAKDVWQTTPATSIDKYVGATIVGRVKVTADASGGGNLGFIEGGGLAAQYHWGGATGQIKESKRGDETYVTGDANYRILRMTAIGPKKSVPWADGFNYAPTQLVGKDDWTGNAGSELLIGEDPDDVTNPCLYLLGGSTTTYAVQEVFAAADETTGLITFTMKQKICYGDAFFWSVWVDDENGVNLARWYGKGGVCRGRIGGTANVTPEIILTDESVWHELKIEIDPVANTSTFYVDNQNIGQISHYVAGNQPGDTVGRIRIERTGRTDEPEADFFCVYFDDFELTGKNIGFERTINLYIDENPVPALTIMPASSSTSARDAFIFGAASTAGAQEVYFDWITATSRGAFAPGEEESVLGYSLVEGGPNGVVSTIESARLANDGVPVSLRGVVTQVYEDHDIYYDVVPAGFLLQSESGDQATGIRVIHDSFLYQGDVVLVQGVARTVPGTTERVVEARAVTTIEYDAPTPNPVAMTNLAAGGGAFGAMKGFVNDASAPTGAPNYAESFDYANGPLGGIGGWSGNVNTAIQVVDNALRVSGGRTEPAVTQYVSCTDCMTGEITFKFKVKPGAGDGTIWDILLADPNGGCLARLTGSGTTLRGRIDVPVFPYTYVTAETPLAPGWNDVEVKINVINNETQFFLNDISFGMLDHSEGNVGDAVGFIRIKRLDNLTSTPNEFVLLDDLALYPAGKMASGPNTVGIPAKIYGKVTSVENDGTVSGSYFYVDDGSGLKDGTTNLYGEPNVGIRCRPIPYYSDVDMPQENDYVWVEGTMGGGMGKSRLFWTTQYGVIGAAQ